MPDRPQSPAADAPPTWLGRWGAPLLLAAAIVLPYHRLATGTGLVITEDGFASDIANGEFPTRVAIGRMLREGELPLWLSDAGGGVSAVVLGAADPLVLVLFGLLPPVAAINSLLLGLLLLCGLGTYAYTRTLGATRAGAGLAGLAFAYSGFVVTQLKHLGILGTVAWLPLGMLAIAEATRPGVEAVDGPRRARWLAALAAIFGLQILAGFPQTAYYVGLAYGTYAVYRAWHAAPGQLARRARMLALVCTALVLGICIGAPLLLSFAELGALSDRGSGADWAYATQLPYDPRMVLSFFVPYVLGDVSDYTYSGSGLFWENYGYLGLIPMCLAVWYAVVHREDRDGRYLALAALAAYLVVLGPNTPVFGWLYELVPGMDRFRFPTRFLFLVDFALAVLGGLGLATLQRGADARRASLLAATLLGLSFLDLTYHQLRQNAIVDAQAFMAPPASVALVDSGERIYTPTAFRDHLAVFEASRGWSGDLQPYVELRQGLQPNLNLLWEVPAVQVYAGLLPQYQLAVFGDHTASGWIREHMDTDDPERIVASPMFTRLVSLYGARYLLTSRELDAPGIVAVEPCGSAPCVYEVERGVLPRARIATRATLAPTEEEAKAALAAPDFDPSAEVVLHEGEAGAGRGSRTGEARITRDSGAVLEVEAVAPDGGYLVLADTWFPGWRAEVDGVEAPIWRANFSMRAVRLEPGTHQVRFTYTPAAAVRGLWAAGLGLLGVLVLALRGARRSRGLDHPPGTPVRSRQRKADHG